ncbi:unnamed protein product [Rotaria socialis]|uniref:Uncharacterized protein n=1 Tax=Rotaria socialis TaxID=392032 RepID=A0A818FY04_9BILA|nr:unnamed protein product [Rotaria socialis]CAF4512215.1 unnamed protein product [Rotaria socialis]
MGDPSRSTSRWSGSLSVATKSTSATSTTTPLVILRRKLFRQSANKKSFTQRMAQSRNDIEELFRLYYSNDLKFDNMQRQIVTGKRISTEQTPSSSQDNLTASSTNLFNGKHFVSREQWSTSELACHGEQQQTSKDQTTTQKRSVRIRTDNNVIINLPPPPTDTSHSLLKAIPMPLNSSDKSSSTQQDDLCDSPLVKSVTFLGDIPSESHEILNKRKAKPKILQRPVSSKPSLSTVPLSPTLVVTNGNNRKDPIVQSNISISTMNSSQPQKSSRSSVLTGSQVLVRQRTPSKLSFSRQRSKLNSSRATISSLSQPTIKPGSPPICSPLSIEPETSELPLFVGGQRVVSIPSKCSRYVLVSFPEVPLRYNAPSYVERLLLPERFPTLFQNIVHSYDPHLTIVQQNPNEK